MICSCHTQVEEKKKKKDELEKEARKRSAAKEQSGDAKTGSVLAGLL